MTSRSVIGRPLDRREGIALALLVAFAAAVDLHCWRRGASLEALLLGASAVGLLVMLVQPWPWLPISRPLSRGALGIACGAVLLGIVTDLVLLLAIAWTLFFWSWLESRLADDSRARLRSGLILALSIFPWVDLDVPALGWTMRDSAAEVAQRLLTGVGVPTTRHGFVLDVAGQPVEIAPQCAGADTLHAMLIMGIATCLVYQIPKRHPVLAVPFLLAYAWLANTIRILAICGAVAWGASPRLLTLLHDLGGWLVIAMMAALLIGTLEIVRRITQRGVAMHAEPTGVTARDATVEEQTSGDTSVVAAVASSSGVRTAAAPWQSYAGLALLVVVCVGAGLVWQSAGLDDASARMALLPASHEGHPAHEVPLSEREQHWLGEAQALKRIYRISGRDFLVTIVDGTKNRRAVHDPGYCWTVLETNELPLPHGYGQALRVADAERQKQVLFWFSDCGTHYASPLRYWWQTSLRRASLGNWGVEPLLVLVEPLEDTPVNWCRVLDQFPALVRL